jgi:opine dehydrogenase
MLSRDPCSICVLGAGNVGKALAADFTKDGHSVRLWDRSQRRLDPVWERGGLVVGGQTYPPDILTTDFDIALQGAEIVVVCTVANAHRWIAEQLAERCIDRPIVLCPGRTGGALEVHDVLGSRNVQATVVELQTSPLISRTVGAEVLVLSRKQTVPAATAQGPLPGLVQQILPRSHDVHSVLITSFGNVGSMLHPPLVLSHLAAIRGGTAGGLYGDPPSAALDVIEELDTERLNVARAYGVQVPSLRDWFTISYGNQEAALADHLVSSPGYDRVPRPGTLATRHLTEDVPMGLVPLHAFGMLAGVLMPMTGRVIREASMVVGRDFACEGRTLADLGLADLDVQQISQLWGP